MQYYILQRELICYEDSANFFLKGFSREDEDVIFHCWIASWDVINVSNMIFSVLFCHL
jgi:hypothetical protein